MMHKLKGGAAHHAEKPLQSTDDIWVPYQDTVIEVRSTQIKIYKCTLQQCPLDYEIDTHFNETCSERSVRCTNNRFTNFSKCNKT